MCYKSWKEEEAIKYKKCGQQSLYEGKIIWAKTRSIKNLDIEKWSSLPGLSGLFISPSLSFFPSCFNWTAVDRKKAGWKGATFTLLGGKDRMKVELNGPLEARAVMRWVQCHGGTSHLETQSSCTKVRKKAQRTIESCMRDRGSPTYHQLQVDKVW